MRRLLRKTTHDWNTSVLVAMLILVTPFLVALIPLPVGVISKEGYKWLTGEDGFLENMQVGCCATSLVLTVLIGRRLSSKGMRTLYFFLAGGFLFLMGEELSWGQRLLGWETPEWLNTLNRQAESNLHNVHGVESAFRGLQLIAGALGSLLPGLALIGWNRLRPDSDTFKLVVPHFSLIPYFFPIFVWRLYRISFPRPKSYSFAISEYNEVMESILYLGVVLFFVFNLRCFRGTPPLSRRCDHDSGGEPGPHLGSHSAAKPDINANQDVPARVAPSPGRSFLGL
ncbi:MAG: hypothetical protein ACE5JX_00115 [Acidobacteriota bacterium]